MTKNNIILFTFFLSCGFLDNTRGMQTVDQPNHFEQLPIDVIIKILLPGEQELTERVKAPLERAKIISAVRDLACTNKKLYEQFRDNVAFNERLIYTLYRYLPMRMEWNNMAPEDVAKTAWLAIEIGTPWARSIFDNAKTFLLGFAF